MQTIQAPVLVVGAGPVGTILALELARHQVASILVERSVRPSLHPKMDFVNARSMELLRRLGLADAVRLRAVDPAHPTNFQWTRGLDQPPVWVWSRPSVNDERERYAAVNDGTAPAESYQRVPGSVLEALLRDAARKHPLIDLREGWTFSDLQVDGDSVLATVVEPVAHNRHAIRTRYLAACDGARSTVRRCLGIGLDESGPPTQHCSVFFISRDPKLRRFARAFVTYGPGGLTLVSRNESDAWTASVPIPVGVPLTKDPMALIQERLRIDFRVERVLSMTQWEGSLTVASSYRQGPAFLVGDAAHQFYPAGGHGANTGIADAVDLGWKLAAAARGWGGPRLLDSYEQERRPVALFNRELCAGALEVGRRFARLDAAGASREQLAGVLEQDLHQVDNIGVHFGYRYAGSPVICHETGPAPVWHWRSITATTWPGARPPAVRLDDESQLFDRFGPGFTLVDLGCRRTGAALVERAARRGLPISYLPLEEKAVRATWERDLVLIRPDQHVAWRGDTPPADWDAVLDRVTGQQIT
jgi:2-polyprenyl-6-methoxyphenol hydroxylase-like FAD-dependent oxidoreductase